MKLLPWLLAAALSVSLPLSAAPRIPAAGTEVVALLPVRDAGLQAQRRQLAARPGDLPLALQLARRYVELGRADADPRWFGQAQAVLAPWWNVADAPPGVRLLRATLLQTGHQFDAALRELRAITAADPRNAQAWLTLATVQAVQGDATAATASCARLSALAGQLETFACLAGASANTARLRGSEKLLAQALLREPDAAPALRTWALTLLAESAARRGDWAAAGQHYQAALKVAPRDSYLLGAYADFLLDRGRAGAVPALLADFDRVDALLLRQALALRVLGESAPLANARAELQARFRAAELRGDGVHLREQARFTLHVLNDAPAALALAQRNWQVQKELADTRILLEAALAAHDRAVVRQVADWVRGAGLEDVAIARLLRGAI